MPQRLIDQLYATTDPDYRQSLARQADIDQFRENAYIHLVRNVKKFERFTVVPLESSVEPHAWSVCLMFYALNRKVNYMPGHIINENIQVPNAKSRKPLGLMVLLSKSFDQKEFKLADEFYTAKRDELGIEGILYLGTSPVEVEVINGAQVA